MVGIYCTVFSAGLNDVLAPRLNFCAGKKQREAAMRCVDMKNIWGNPIPPYILYERAPGLAISSICSLNRSLIAPIPKSKSSNRGLSEIRYPRLLLRLHMLDISVYSIQNSASDGVLKGPELMSASAARLNDEGLNSGNGINTSPIAISE